MCSAYVVSFAVYAVYCSVNVVMYVGIHLHSVVDSIE